MHYYSLDVTNIGIYKRILLRCYVSSSYVESVDIKINISMISTDCSSIVIILSLTISHGKHLMCRAVVATPHYRAESTTTISVRCRWHKTDVLQPTCNRFLLCHALVSCSYRNNNWSFVFCVGSTHASG